MGLFGMALELNSMPESDGASQTPQLQKNFGASQLHAVFGALVQIFGVPLLLL